MNLRDFFNGVASATLIYRGDCNIRGHLRTPVVREGDRFDVILGANSYTFIADRVTVKPLARITRDELSRHVNGPVVTPLIPGDEGQMVPDEPCTVIEFRPETAQTIPAGMMLKQTLH